MKHWAQLEERGVIWGMQLLLKVYLWCGRFVLQLFLYPIVSYYWLLNRRGREASRDYLRRIEHFLPAETVRTGLFGSYLHFISFANALIDKLAAWSGRVSMQDVVYHGREQVEPYLEKRQGVLMLGSHLGNLEVCRVIAFLNGKATINVLVHTRHTQKFNQVMNQYAGGNAEVNLIQVSEVTAATAMMLQDKIEQGEFVVIAADRVPLSSGRTSQAEFLGATANFPQGAFILASLLKCPVFTLFCLKQQNKHHIYFDHFSDGLIFSKTQRQAGIAKCMQDFAKVLQRYCLIEPLQWFNFFDFWQQDDD